MNALFGQFTDMYFFQPTVLTKSVQFYANETRAEDGI